MESGAWERCVPVAVRAGDKAERVEELTLRLALSPAKLPHSGRVRRRAQSAAALAARAAARCETRRLAAARAIRRPAPRRAAADAPANAAVCASAVLRRCAADACRAPAARRRRCRCS
jgi:hypothetical protein